MLIDEETGDPDEREDGLKGVTEETVDEVNGELKGFPEQPELLANLC